MIHLKKYKKLGIISLLIFFCFGIISLYLGQDYNWDLVNYHYYDAYAFLNNRIGYDFAPAQIQTFHNPTLYIPVYWLIKFFPPRAVGFILGGIQGLNIVIVYYLSLFILGKAKRIRNHTLLLFLVVIACASSPIFLSEIGTTMGDNVLSLFILLSLLLIFRAISKSEMSCGMLLVAGILMGCSMGLKLTNISYVIGAIGALAILSIGPNFFIILMCFGIGILSGFLISGGYWMWILSTYYDSPFFPYYNSYFKSKYFAEINSIDMRWYPKSILHALSYPFLWAKGEHPSLEIPFRDIRWAIAVALSAIIWVLGLSACFGKSGGKGRLSQLVIKPDLNQYPLIFIILFTPISFIVWLVMFGYSRYLIPLDLLCPLYILCLCDFVPRLFAYLGFSNLSVVRIFPRFMQVMLPAMLICMILMVRVPSWGRTLWRETWFGPIKSSKEFKSNSIVLMFSSEPTSYIIPNLPSSLRFVRVHGNLFSDRKLIEKTKLQEQLKQMLVIEGAEYYSLSPLQSPPTFTELEEIGFSGGENDCEFLYPYNQTLRLCRLSKVQIDIP